MSIVQIHVPLVDDGVEVWRPVQARALGGGVFEILDVQPSHEHWQFQHGSRVRCRMKVFAGGESGLEAYEAVAP